MSQITRHFATIEGRDVHYRRCGDGPALVLLHASPVSSRVFVRAMEHWSEHFTCFAFDTPGNGLSTPLEIDEPTIADYADAQVRLLDQLGVESFIVYGRHTGASIAVEIARRHGDRLTLALTDGYPVFSKEQRKAYLDGYLADLPLSDDGSHLAWLWSRYRDQFIFWPWNKKHRDARADVDMPDTDFLHDGVIALMEAGNNYKGPYSAVFRHDAMETLNAVTAPVCIASRPGDSLYKQFAHFPDTFWREEMPREAEAALARELEIMLTHRPAMPAPQLPRVKTGSSRIRHQFVDSGGEQLCVYSAGRADDTATVVLGPSPGTVGWYQEGLRPLSEGQYLVCIDPAGCGNSDAPANGNVSMMHQARRAATVMQNLGIAHYNLVGIGASAGTALEIAREHGDRVQGLALVDPLTIPESQRNECLHRYANDVSPTLHGTHLLELWHQLRDAKMWFPWFDQRRAAVRTSPPNHLDFAALQADLLTLSKHARFYEAHWESAWRYPLEQVLKSYPRTYAVIATERGIVPAAPGDTVKTAELGAHLRAALNQSSGP